MSRGNLILAVLALSLAGLLMLDTGAPEPPASAPLTTLSPDAVGHIALYLGDADTPAIRLQRQDAGWMLTEPVAIAADAFTVGQILALLAAESRERRDPAALDLQKLKLAPPLWRVRFDDAELAIGAVESLRQLRYVRHGQELHLVPDFNPGPFDGNYADLVSRRLLPATAKLRQIRWPDTEPVAAEALAEDKRRFWLEAQAQWTARPLPADFASVRARVTVTTAESSIDFLISAREPRVKLIRPDIDVLYNLPPSAAAELLEP